WSGRVHRLCGERAHESGFAGADRSHGGGEMAALRRRQRSGERMRAGGLLSGRDGGEPLPGAVTNHRHSDSQKTARAVRRWQRSEALRGADEPVGLETETAVGMASPEGGYD